MKKAVLLHGTDGTPEGGWRPYVKAQLQERGYEVWVPALPDNHTPNMQVYNDFLLTSGWDFTDNLVIGHSSGAVQVLNLLMDKRCPAISAAVMVGAWAHNAGTDMDTGQFKDTFPQDGFAFEVIARKAKHRLFVHGDNDPYCPLEQAKWLAAQLSSEILIIPDGGHLGGEDGYREFPELIEALVERKML
jgi:hypothetical protein